MDEQMKNNGYQYQPNPSPMPNPNKDGIAIAVLVLGIVSICFCCVAWGVISLACAIVSLVLYSRNKTMFSPQKKGMATAGFITSIIGCVLGAIVLAVCVVAFCTAASAYSYSTYKMFL